MSLGREFGWTLDEMRQLTPRELAAILNELRKQKDLTEYAEFRGKWAFLAAVITNAAAALAGMFSKQKPKQATPDDFVDKEWYKRISKLFPAEDSGEKNKWASHIKQAKAKGLKGPW